jgi:hypothetical protein
LRLLALKPDTSLDVRSDDGRGSTSIAKILRLQRGLGLGWAAFSRRLGPDRGSGNGPAGNQRLKRAIEILQICETTSARRSECFSSCSAKFSARPKHQKNRFKSRFSPNFSNGDFA